ncbi:MAG TPA: hypothetical protein VKP10_09545 [Gemmatimonadales bacterium]|nr:hypothetical protein [Gemmatimonadales bacterium]
MPGASVWFIRAALAYLLAGFTLGALLLAAKGLPLPLGVWRWLPVHFELLLVGWFVQLVMGVAYWIFPRFGMTRAARGREGLAWLALVLLNGGIWAVSVAVLYGPATLAVIGRAMEVLAAATMALNVWARTRASGISPM